MKNGIIGLLILAYTNVHNWLWHKADKPPAAEQEHADFEDYSAAVKCLHGKQYGDAINRLSAFTDVQDKISFLKVFFQLNPDPGKCVLTVAQLQEIANAREAITKCRDASHVHMPEYWKYHLLAYTKRQSG